MCGQWYYGNLIIRETDSPVPETPQAYKCVMIGDIEDGSAEEVEEETIGQYTGLCDKNGKEIFEGDIVTMYANINKLSDPMLSNAEPKYRLTTIVYDDAAFKITFEGKPDAVLNHYSGAMVKNMEVVGNIHDNPELLRGE